MKNKTKKVTRFSDKTNGLLNYADLKKPQFKIMYAVMLLILISFSLICLLPLIWVFLSGFKSVEEMYKVPPTLFPKSFDFGNVFKIWNDIDVLQYFRNSVILIVGSLVFNVVVNGLAGYVLSRLKPAGSRIIDTLMFWSMLLPGISMVPLYMTFVNFFGINMTGQFLPLWMMQGCAAFTVILFKNFFNGIPMSYVEAARIDGCSDLGIFGRIILPLSKPIIAVVSIFCVTGEWGNFMWPYLLLGNSDKEPVAVMLYTINQFGALMPNEYLLLLFISIVPMIIVYALFSKQIVGGVSMSGLKG